jgi:hypothetical protein
MTNNKINALERKIYRSDWIRTSGHLNPIQVRWFDFDQ